MHLSCVIGSLQRQQGEAAVLRVAERHWQVWQVPNCIIIGCTLFSKVEGAYDVTCMSGNPCKQYTGVRILRRTHNQTDKQVSRQKGIQMSTLAGTQAQDAGPGNQTSR